MNCEVCGAEAGKCMNGLYCLGVIQAREAEENGELCEGCGLEVNECETPNACEKVYADFAAEAKWEFLNDF